MTVALRPPARTPSGDATGPRRRDRLGVVGEIAARRRADLAPVLADLDAATRRRRLAAAPAARPVALRLAMPGLHLIAEIKRSSPSAGRIAAPDDDLFARARAYDRAGAAAISVLCEPHWFGGSIDDLAAVRRLVRAPVLAKDFVVDPRQLELIRVAGADAVLLLAVLQPRRALARLVDQALDLGLEPLVEAHDEQEIEAALSTRARLIGINNRDLRTLAVDPERAARLRRFVPEDRLVIAESGVREPATVAGWRAMGFDAALVGEALVRAADPESSARAFIAAGRDTDDPAELARVPFVKICGIVDADGVRAAIDAGADAVGLNLVPGTPRALDLDEAAALARLIRASSPPAGGPAVVAITVDLAPDERRRIGAALDADAIQLSGDEAPETIAGADRPMWKVIHLPATGGPANDTRLAGNGKGPAPDGLNDADAGGLAASFVGQARAFVDAGAARIMLDTAGGPHPGGTGLRASPALVAAIAV